MKNYSNGFRFAKENYSWTFDADKKYTLKEQCERIIKYEGILSKFGDLNNDLHLYRMLDRYSILFNGINKIKKYLENNNEDNKTEKSARLKKKRRFIKQ